FPKLPFIHSLHDNTSTIRPGSRSDLIYVPITHNPCLTCLNASIDFPLFYNRLVSNKRHICAHALACLSLVTHIELSLFSRQRQHTLVSTGFYISCSSPLFLIMLLSLSVTRFKLLMASLSAFLT
ncbi:unnamed protein product, partial [Hymenolepis diminuta]